MSSWTSLLEGSTSKRLIPRLEEGEGKTVRVAPKAYVICLTVCGEDKLWLPLLLLDLQRHANYGK